jgi:hypothetical protein
LALTAIDFHSEITYWFRQANAEGVRETGSGRQNAEGVREFQPNGWSFATTLGLKKQAN